MGPPANPEVTVSRLLSPDDRLVQMAQTLRAAAQRYGLPYRIDECNSVYGGGKPGVSDVFASALWGADLMFTLAQNGAGVNFHGGGVGPYTPIAIAKGQYSARPLYYGMLLFKLGSQGRLLPLTVNQTFINLTAYAVLADDGNVVLTLINKDTQNANLLVDPGRSFAVASVQRLTAPSLDSTSGVALAGDTVKSDASWTPRIQESAPSGNSFSVSVPAASAALVVFE